MQRVDRRAVADTPTAFYELALAEGWTDGLPVIAPTEALVDAMLAATPDAPDRVLGSLPPQNREATVELVAINAVMAGCAPEGFPFVIAALESILQPAHNLYGVASTTGSAHPMLIVNGPSRDHVGIDYQDGCMGGAAGRGSATIGRAVSLCLRNIGGQLVGVTSRSVFGQPARVGGLCFGEWEERSPWITVAEQLGRPGGVDVVTTHSGMGTMAIADINCDDELDLLRLVAKSLSFPLGNKFLSPTPGNGQVVIAINPEWARRFGRVFPDVADVKQYLLEHAWQPIDLWPEAGQRILEQKQRV
ncbi:MAG: hypothetical protein KDB21_06785, partial [Acidimicrobiales bacterium]|nr:hypothetical protein [Acidimicrobiales bacterium]